VIIMEKITIVFLVWNLFVFLVFGLDKFLSKLGNQRISERFLVLISIAFGSLGAIFAMSLFRHKTLKAKFKIIIPLAFVVHALLILYLLK